MTAGRPATPVRPSPLAYLFWHRPLSDDPDAYESALATFHRSLAADPPVGLLGSWTISLVGPPWFEEGAPCYLDWYVVEDFRALGLLQTAAVDDGRVAVHDTVASLSGSGAGGLVALVSGDVAVPAVPTLSFVDKPRGTPYDRFRARLDGALAGRGAWWVRQLAMGPGPEIVVVTSGPPAATLGPARSIEHCRVIDGGS
jgi:hypothetical protein